MGPVWYPNLLGANPQCVLPCGFPGKQDQSVLRKLQEQTDGTAETAAGADGGNHRILVETWIVNFQSWTIIYLNMIRILDPFQFQSGLFFVVVLYVS